MADTQVASSVYPTLDEQTGLWGPYWSDESTAIIVFTDTERDLSYARTADKGASWTVTEIEAGSVVALACWYDKETPGNNGTTIHIAWLDGDIDDAFYITLDVAANSLGTLRTVDSTITAVLFADWQQKIAITQTVSGNIIYAFSTPNEIECYKSSDNFATAGTSIANVFETGNEEDWVLLFPANTGDDNDACAFFWDRSSHEITLKMYDDSADAWTETAIASDCVDSAQRISMDAAVRHSDNHVLLAFHNNADAAVDDIQTYDLTVDSIASPTVTAKTNVFTNQIESAQVSVFINQQNDDVYVAYPKGGTMFSAVDVVFHLSTDGMGSWGGEQAYSESAPDDFRLVSAGRTVGDDGGRYQPAFYDDDDFDIYINETNDIEIAASVGAQTLTPAGIASAEAFGSATVSLAAQTITAGAIASAETFGAATLTTTVSFTASGIVSLEAFGSATISTTVTVNLQVSANNDDAYEYQDDTNFDNTGPVDQSASASIDARTISGHRFTSVTVPKGATIITATLQLYVYAASFDDINVDIHGEDADNAVDFAADADTINRTRTAASVAWVTDSLGTGFKSSPDIKTAIQEIVDRGSWASGNALMILCKGKSDVTKRCFSRGHEDQPSEAAKLDITYTATGEQTLSPTGIASLEAFGSATLTTTVSFTATGIASLEAFGVATVLFPAQTITATGIASLEAFGSTQLSLSFTASGITSLESFGAATVFFPSQTITGVSIISLEAFGGATISTTVGITAGAIASLEAFGSAVVTTTVSFTATGIISLEAFGSATVANVQIVTGTGIASAEAFGAATLTTGTVTVTASGIVSLEAFGAATISTTVTVTASAISSLEAFGSATISTTISFTASGITSLEAFGSASVVYVATPTGIASAEAFGAATITTAITISASSIASLETFGSASVAGGVVTLSPDAITTGEAFGSAALTTTISFTASAIASEEVFGAATVLFPTQAITASGISSLEAFGSATLTTTVTVTAGAIASAEVFGAATITTGAITLSPSGISSAEVFGSAALSTTISFTATGIASLEAFGSASVMYVVTPTGIVSLEAFGSAQVNLGITASSIVSLETFGAAVVSGGLIVTFSYYGQWRALINPADYPTDTQFFFEAVVSTSDAGFPSHARLYNITDGAFVADSQVSSVDTTSERVRSGVLSLPAGDKEYRVQRGGLTGATYKCYAARVLAKSS